MPHQLMKKQLFSIFSVAFLLNLFWELSHSLLYNWNLAPLKNDIYFYIPHILRASLIDALIIFVILFIFRKIKSNKRRYLVTALSALSFSISIEIRAKFLNLWAYNESMPLIFGLGLTPLIQLPLIALVTIYLVEKIKENKD